MNRFFLLILLCLGVACKDASNKTAATFEASKKESILAEVESEIIVENSIDSIALGINFSPKGNYNTIKQTIKKDRAYFKRLLQQNKEKAIDTASKYLYHKLLNEIVPHWYGTPWDFNGHTDIPNDSEIACGYFVSTTLRHLSFRLNRFKMAQQAGLNEAITLQPKNELKIYRNISQDQLKIKLNKVYADGLYFVGLSNHVGYVLIKNKELYFLHSSYYDNKVIIEEAATSPCFQSDIYVFAEITSNRELIQKWIQNKTIPVHQ